MNEIDEISTVKELVTAFGDTMFLVTLVNGNEYSVPNDLGNKDRILIQEWEDAGNTIEPYEG